MKPDLFQQPGPPLFNGLYALPCGTGENDIDVIIQHVIIRHAQILRSRQAEFVVHLPCAARQFR